jgi:hypothetical protein
MATFMATLSRTSLNIAPLASLSALALPMHAP